ncbi:MAG: 4-hydroxy-3-methylbut-2-enyl diphosphate reductase [Gammaproteobacteria bacterium]|nr:4-hydroxy-3-methylbut-2-enyl diphosphate reductase [Gammaproteobacteria bacterium]
MKKLALANPRGFCAGVDRAIAIVNRAIEIFGAPIYVRHEVVHNKFVVDELRDKGAVFVDELSEVPDGATVIFSAHGVSKDVADRAAARDLQVFDATCPLVTKVHLEVARHALKGEEVILIGHEGHPEVEGTLGRYDSSFGGSIYLIENPEDVATLEIRKPETLAYVTQTTLSMDDTKIVVDALRERFPNLEGPKKDDICYATQNRQDAVKQLATGCDVIFVVGSPNSSNSNRLREVAAREGSRAYLIDKADEIERSMVEGASCVGVTAGASAPEILVQEVLTRLEEWGHPAEVIESGESEDVIFALPKALR